MLQTRVIRPLQGLLDCFHGPTRLIQKRQDKHLDYSASLQKREKNKDPSKSKVVSHHQYEVASCSKVLWKAPKCHAANVTDSQITFHKISWKKL